MNLAYKYPIIFWNTACLIVNSGSLDESKNDSTNYVKVAKAISNITSKGIEVSLPDINSSDFGFTPDAENNRILYGLKPITNISTELSQEIIKNRTFESFYDFLDKIEIKKQAMVNLIKSGAFDKFYNNDRRFILILYLWLKTPKKEKITLQNFSKLIEYNLLPEELNEEKRIFQITKELKKKYKDGEDLFLSQKATNSLLKLYPDLDFYSFQDGRLRFPIKNWESFYKNRMAKAKDWIAENQQILIERMNDLTFLEEWEKYKGADTIAGWEMESLCFYYHDHELKGINYGKYGFVNFFNLPQEPEVEYEFKKKDVDIKMYKIRKIVGTVIAKDKNRSSISLLTLEGVVNVKFNKEYFAMFDKQISERLPDGTKRVIEKSWFTRGTFLVVQGFRRGDDFVAKRYSKTPGHTLYRANLTPEKELILYGERYQGGFEEEED